MQAVVGATMLVLGVDIMKIGGVIKHHRIDGSNAKYFTRPKIP